MAKDRDAEHARHDATESAEQTPGVEVNEATDEQTAQDDQQVESSAEQPESAEDAAQAALAKLRELVVRAKRGDREILPELRRVLDENPHLSRRPGNLALQAQVAWIKTIAGDDLHLRETLVRHVNELKQSLCGPNSSPMEQLLVERVVATWLRLWHAEALDAQQDETSLKWAEFRLKRLKVAHDLHTKSIGALATLKKLMPPQPAAPAALPAPETPAPVSKTNGHHPGGNNGHGVNGHANRLTKLLCMGGVQGEQ